MKDLYAQIIGTGGKRILFDIDCALKGLGKDGRPAPYCLSREQYAIANEAIATLFAIFDRPNLVPTPITKARSDAHFQRFMGRVVETKKGIRRERNKGGPQS